MIAGDKKNWLTFPPVVIIGVVIILASILVVVAIESIRTQRANTEKLLLAQGTVLIRAFEAGAKTGVLGVQWQSPQIGKWLMEASHQSGVLYMFITDHKGTVLAHSDPARVGTTYGQDLSLDAISQSIVPSWRVKEKNVFEITSRCAPLPGQLTTYIRTDSPHEWLRVRITPKESEEVSRLVIFVGLDMRPLKASQESGIRNTIITLMILLLVGLAGIIMVFIVHRYQSAKISLSQIRAFSDTLVKNMPVGIVSMDISGRISSCNETAEDLLRLRPHDIMGQEAEKVLPPVLQQFLRAPQSDDVVQAKEVELSGNDGKSLFLEVTITALTEEDGTMLGHLLLLRDFTEMRRLRREIERSQRLASLGRLAAGVAHEIRNPLSSIKGFATYFSDRYQDVPEDKETADIMVREVDRLDRVVGELLTFARPMNLNREIVSLPALLQDALKMVESETKDRRIRIVTDFDGDPGPVFVDPDKIRQVLLNLYLNAIQSMGGGGTLFISLSCDGNGGATIIIQDTGVGIEKKDLGKIFDPYFTTKPSGTGLGLAIVHRIIEAHQGAVQVDSEPGKGTSVAVILPGDYEHNQRGEHG